MRRALAVTCFALTWIVACPAYAADDATAIVTRAQALEKSKKLKDAAEQWEKAFDASKDASHLYRAAKDRQKGGDPAGAANDYGRFLAALKAGPVGDTSKETKKEKAVATKEIANLQKTLGRFALRASGSTKINVDGVTIDLARAEEWYVMPGAHVIEAKFETGVGKENATAVKGQSVAVVIAAPAEGENGATPPPPPEGDKPKEADTTSKPPVTVNGKPGDKFSLPPFWFYVLGGVTGVIGGLTILSAIDVSSKKSDFDKEKTQDNLDAGKSAQSRTNVLLVTTGVFVALTAVTALVLVDWKRTDTKLGLGPGSLLLQGTF